MDFKPRCIATCLSEVPHRDVHRACEVILKNFPEAPFIPRLNRSMRWFLNGLPCIVIDHEKKEFSFDLSRDQELLEFYELYGENKIDHFAVPPKFLPGLYALVDLLTCSPHPQLRLITLEIPGPFSFGMVTTDKHGVPVWYDENIRDLIIKATGMKIKWIEKYIEKALPDVQVMIILGEPSLSVYGSPFVSIARQEIPDALSDVLSFAKGVRSVHCCANIDWALLTDSNTQVINFDAFRFSEELALCDNVIGDFLERGGMLAWGIVPVDEESLITQDVASLTTKFEQGIQLLVNEGLDRTSLLEHSFITPCCTTSTLPVELAERALQWTGEISRRVKDKYF